MFTARDLLGKALDYDFWNTSKRMLNSKTSQPWQLHLERLLIGFDILKVNAKPQPQMKGNYQPAQQQAVDVACNAFDLLTLGLNICIFEICRRFKLIY